MNYFIKKIIYFLFTITLFCQVNSIYSMDRYVLTDIDRQECAVLKEESKLRRIVAPQILKIYSELEDIQEELIVVELDGIKTPEPSPELVQILTTRWHYLIQEKIKIEDEIEKRLMCMLTPEQQLAVKEFVIKRDIFLDRKKSADEVGGTPFYFFTEEFDYLRPKPKNISNVAEYFSYIRSKSGGLPIYYIEDLPLTEEVDALDVDALAVVFEKKLTFAEVVAAHLVSTPVKSFQNLVGECSSAACSDVQISDADVLPAGAEVPQYVAPDVPKALKKVQHEDIWHEVKNGARPKKMPKHKFDSQDMSGVTVLSGKSDKKEKTGNAVAAASSSSGVVKTERFEKPVKKHKPEKKKVKPVEKDLDLLLQELSLGSVGSIDESLDKAVKLLNGGSPKDLQKAIAILEESFPIYKKTKEPVVSDKLAIVIGKLLGRKEDAGVKVLLARLGTFFYDTAFYFIDEKVLAEALQKNNSPQSLFMRGYILSRCGHVDLAIDMFEAALNLQYIPGYIFAEIITALEFAVASLFVNGDIASDFAFNASPGDAGVLACEPLTLAKIKACYLLIKPLLNRNEVLKAANLYMAASYARFILCENYQCLPSSDWKIIVDIEKAFEFKISGKSSNKKESLYALVALSFGLTMMYFITGSGGERAVSYKNKIIQLVKSVYKTVGEIENKVILSRCFRALAKAWHSFFGDQKDSLLELNSYAYELSAKNEYDEFMYAKSLCLYGDLTQIRRGLTILEMQANKIIESSSFIQASFVSVNAALFLSTYYQTKLKDGVMSQRYANLIELAAAIGNKFAIEILKQISSEDKKLKSAIMSLKNRMELEDFLLDYAELPAPYNENTKKEVIKILKILSELPVSLNESTDAIVNLIREKLALS